MNKEIDHMRTENGALINMDVSKYYEIVRRRKEKEEGQAVCEKLKYLENELQEIKRVS